MREYAMNDAAHERRYRIVSKDLQAARNAVEHWASVERARKDPKSRALAGMMKHDAIKQVVVLEGIAKRHNADARGLPKIETRLIK